MKSHCDVILCVWMDSVKPKFRISGIKLTTGELEWNLGVFFNIILFLTLKNR